MDKNLLPCPFCGGKAFMWNTTHELWIECENYHVDKHRVMIHGKFGGDVIDAWNRRATGKHDCTGKMIFTGDTLEMQSTGQRGEVFYNPENAAFEVKMSNGNVLGLDAESEEYKVVILDDRT